MEERIRRLGGGLLSAHLVTVFGIALSNAFFALTALTLPWSRPWRTANHRQLRPLWMAIGAYMLLVLASSLASREPAISIRDGLSDAVSLVTLVLAVLLVRGETEVRRVLRFVLVAGALFAIAGLFQFLGDFGDIDQRIRGPFSHYMTFAGILLLCDLLLLARLAVGEAWKKAGHWIALILINAALIGSLTRSAWVALVTAVVALLALRRPRWLAWAIPVGLVLLLLVPLPVVERAKSIFDLEDISNYDRICMAEAGVRMIADRPALGLGPGLVRRWYPIYRHPTAPRLWVPHLHSSFLQIGASRGLATLAAYLGLMWVAMRECWRRYREEGRASGPRADLYVGVLLCLVAFNVAGLFEDNWSDTEVQRILLFVLAIPFCLGQRPALDAEET